MKSLAYFLVLLLASLVLTSAHSAELLLRERATQHGAVIRLGDIADIASATSAELKALASVPLLPAPAQGTQQFLTAAQVRDLLVDRGIRTDQVTINGANLVEIGAVTRPVKIDSNPTTPKLTHQEAELSVQQAIERHLLSIIPTGHWRVEVSLTARQASKIPKLGADFEVRGKQQIRSGNQRFFLSRSDGKEELLVNATLTQIQPVVVVRQPIEAGRLVRAADLEILEREGNLPKGSLISLEQAIGKVARRALRPEQIVQESHLRASWQVRRGETVKMFVRTGGVVVWTWAVAKENGAIGELITVESLEDKQRLNVSVSGPGEVTVYATGGRATDYASLNRDASRRR